MDRHTAQNMEELDGRFGAAAEPAWLWDGARCRIVWANDAGIAFWGARSLFDLIEYAFTADSGVARLARTGEAMLAPMDKPQLARARTEETALPDGGRGTLVIILSLQEPEADGITARKLALLDAAPVPLLLTDESGDVIEQNESAQTVARALPRDLLQSIARAAIVDGTANRIAPLTIGGRETTLQLYAKRLADPARRAPAALVRISDISERLRLEAMLRAKLAGHLAELQKAQIARETAAQESLAGIEAERAKLKREREDVDARLRAKSDFLAKLVHEMRNPLNAIIGFSEIMQQARFGPLGDKRYEGYMDDIRMSAGHLMSLVNDMLDLAAIEAGKFRIHFDSVALASVIDDCIRLLKPQASDLGIELKSAVPANLPPVVADARALRQVMLNLISNAVKFTPAGGEVFVSATLTGEGGVSVAVRDTGVGMTRSEIELALEPFGQVDGPLQRERKGTGLGLPLAKALTEANKAQFNLFSEPNRGTVAELVFPSARVLAG